MWVRTDDKAPHHPKLIRAGAEAAWFWHSGLCYSNAHQLDGRIDKDVLTALYTPLAAKVGKLAAKLVKVGLWHDRGDHYEIHDYKDHQEAALKEVVEARKEYERDRKREQRRGQKREDVPDNVPDKSGNVPDPVPPAPRASPVPSRPDPAQGEKSAQGEPALGASTALHPSRLLPVLLEELGSEAFERDLKPAPSAPPGQLQAAAARVHELVQAGTFPSPRAAARALVRAGLDLVRDHKRPFGLALLDATVAGPAAPIRDHIQPWDSV